MLNQDQMIKVASDRSPKLFDNRSDAGLKLSKLIKSSNIQIDQYIAIPRGGIPVARELAGNSNLLVCPSKKITITNDSIFGVGAIDVNGNPVINNATPFTDDGLNEMISRARSEQLTTVSRVAFAKCNMKGLDGKRVAIVDDGISTGYTMIAALTSLLMVSKPSAIYCISPVVSTYGLHNIVSVYPEVLFIGIFFSTDTLFIVDAFYQSFETVSI